MRGIEVIVLSMVIWKSYRSYLYVKVYLKKIDKITKLSYPLMKKESNYILIKFVSWFSTNKNIQVNKNMNNLTLAIQLSST